MTRSERLAKDGIIEVLLHGSFLKAKVTQHAIAGRYVATDFKALYNGHKVEADIYEMPDGTYAVIVNEE